MTAPVPSLPDLLSGEGSYLLGWSCLADPTLAGLMARSGFDVVLLDQQHGTYDVPTCVAGLTELALAGKPGLVRISVGDFRMASRMLDAGAAGIVAPMINTVQDAKALVAATKFPPVGQRSWGPDRAMAFSGLDNPQDYLTQANGRTMTIAMCETREAIANLSDIVAVPGIDGILVGPGDLSIALSNGAAFDPLGSAVTEALGEIVRVTLAAGKVPCAFAAGGARASEMLKMGFKLSSIGYDGLLISDAFAKAVAEAKQA